MLRSAQRLTVSRPGLASARQRTPPLSRVASGGSPPPLRVGCAVLHWMASPARGGSASAGPYPPDAVEPLGPPLSSPRTSLHQPDVPGFTVGSSLLRMDDCLCGSRVLEPLVCHPFFCWHLTLHSPLPFFASDLSGKMLFYCLL
eukprot:COSAG02_NODE_170_length_31534_cov_33.568498_13_plen_144_part_00